MDLTVQKFGRLTVINLLSERVKNGYNDTLTIDRIDNNRRSNINITYNGKTKTIKQWAEELGINYNTLRMQHFRGWSDKECLLGRYV